jgi:hypothetical protein
MKSQAIRIAGLSVVAFTALSFLAIVYFKLGQRALLQDGFSRAGLESPAKYGLGMETVEVWESYPICMGSLEIVGNEKPVRRWLHRDVRAEAGGGDIRVQSGGVDVQATRKSASNVWHVEVTIPQNPRSLLCPCSHSPLCSLLP